MIGGRSWPYWGLIAVLVVLHFGLHLGLGLGAYAPDLLTVAVLLSARRVRPGVAAAVGLVLGLLRDSLALVAFGADAIVLTVLGYAGSRLRDLFVGDSLLFLWLYLFIGVWLHQIGYYLITMRMLPADPLVRLLVESPIRAAYAAVAGLIALAAYRLLGGDN